MARVAVIGDIAGHVAELRAELVRLGADPTGLELPPDLTVVQVGDLIHRGPDSEGVLALVDSVLQRQPTQWVQLLGNHEAQYLREPMFSWPERIERESELRLQSWWSGALLQVAVAVLADGEQWLITHAGLTEGFWREALAAPSDALDAARALNALVGTHEDVLFHAGEMLGGGDPDYRAGPIWASAGGEVIPSWRASRRRLPFSQVHGHSSSYDWRARRFRAAPEVQALLSMDTAASHETATLPGGRIVGVDPGHGRRPRRPWRSLVLTGARVLR